MNLEKKLLFQIIGQRLARIPIRTQIIHLSIFHCARKYEHHFFHYRQVHA